MVDIETLRCPECGCDDVKAETVEVGETGRVWCPECGYESEAKRISLAELFADS